MPGEEDASDGAECGCCCMKNIFLGLSDRY